MNALMNTFEWMSMRDSENEGEIHIALMPLID